MYYLPTKLYHNFQIDKIYTVHYFEYHKDYTFAGERHDFWELMYVDRGEIIALADEKEFVLKQNQLTFCAPGEFHAVRANGAVAPNTIIVSFACESRELQRLAGQIFYVNEYERSLLAGIAREAKKAYANDLSDPAYRRLKKKKRTPVGTAGYAAEQMLGCYLQLLLIDFLRNGGFARRKLPGKVMQDNDHKAKFATLNQWIEGHMDRAFTVEDLCAEAMLNKSTVERIFRENSGMSAIAYCRAKKIEAAKKLLREDALNISQISERLGFSSVHYFSRTFRQLENMPPSEYAKSAKAMIDHAPLMQSGNS